MSSNSIRIGAELFEHARKEGELQSRSTAQQVEHWARLGAALEAAGLTMPAITALLMAVQEVPIAEAQLWQEKRAAQARDHEAVRSGVITGEQLRWFRRGAAKRVKLVNSPL